MCVRTRARACARACVRVYVRVYVRVCVRVRACVRVCVCARVHTQRGYACMCVLPWRACTLPHTNTAYCMGTACALHAHCWDALQVHRSY